jgi:membrane protein
MAIQASQTIREASQVRAFAHLLWQRFKDDRCFEAAGALSYASVFAVVPLATASIGILSAFPAFSAFSNSATDFIFEHLVPHAARAAQTYLSDFALNAKQLTWLGVLGLMVSAVLMLASAEDTLNRIFRADRHRPPLKRFLMYWTMLTLGPLLVVASFAVSATLLALPGAEGESWPHLLPRWVWALVPGIIIWSGVTFAFRLVPNTKVRLSHAAIGAFLCCMLVWIAKRAFAAFLGSSQTYQQIYGALAVFPVLLVWIYVTWSSLLLGALLAACLGAYRAPVLTDAAGHELFTFIRLLAAVRSAWAKRGAFARAQWIAEAAGLHPERAQQLLALALSERVLHEGEDAVLAPAPAPPELTLGALVERGGFRLPDEAELAALEVVATARERKLVALLRGARVAEQGALNQTLEPLLAALAGVGPPANHELKETKA